MSEIPQPTFGQILDHEVDHIIGTVDMFVQRPGEYDEPQNYMWKYDNDNRTGLAVIRRARGDDGREYLLVTKVLVDPETDKLNVTKYALALDGGEFWVTRELHDTLDSLLEPTDDNEIDPDELLGMMGMLYPSAGDWDDFVAVIHHGYVYHELND